MSKIFNYADYLHRGMNATAQWEPEEVREMVMARVNGKLLSGMGKHWGISPQTISKILKRLKPYNGEQYDWCYVLDDGDEGAAE